MTNQISNGTMFVDKRDVLNSMRAVYINLVRQSHLMNDDSYTMGYHEGFENALLSVAAIVGVEDEFEEAMVKQKTRQFLRMRVIARQNTKT